MPDPTELLADWKAKTDAATPGEWGAFQKVADDAEFSMDDDMDTTTSSVECITGLRAEDGVGRFCITIADPIVSAVDAEFIAMSRSAFPRLLAAVESVLGLHTPFEAEGVRPPACKACIYPHPCPTVRAITDALDAALSGSEPDDRESSNSGSDRG